MIGRLSIFLILKFLIQVMVYRSTNEYYCFDQY